MPLTLVLTATMTLLLLRWLAPLAIAVNLVDVPSARKRHTGAVPLVGGVGIFISSLLTVISLHAIGVSIPDYVLFFWLCGAFLIITGVIDDNKELSAKVRILIQALIALILVMEGATVVASLGTLVSDQEVLLGPVAGIFTLIAIVGLINAFNMVDGIDGLLAGLTLVALCSVAWLAGFNASNSHLAMNAMIVAAAIVPFMLFNLGLKGLPKVFMGDAGSMFLGLFVAWLLIHGSQQGASHIQLFKPATALWLVGIPLIDLFSTVIRRVVSGHSPLHADRLHIHHLVHQITGSSSKTLLTILVASVALASVGIMLEIFLQSSRLSFAGFFLVVFSYSFWSNRFIKRVQLET